MSGTLNKVMLIGHLGDDVKLSTLIMEDVLQDFLWLLMKHIQ
ncbi:MAG: hypothetical protein CM15mP109_05270 [Candidatus Dadabacteria bacterium]|nr:MAG: hypothetical protein CM15mP109_05270 [Candidatus Dadabacteria bacterium]